MTVPDAWDECGGCGHDRDDHDTTGCQACGTVGPWSCTAFEEPE